MKRGEEEEEEEERRKKEEHTVCLAIYTCVCGFCLAAVSGSNW